MPTEWHFHGDEVFLRRDHLTGNILISASDREHRKPLLSRVLEDLLAGWLVFAAIVAVTILSQKILDHFEQSEPQAHDHLRWYHLVAFAFELTLFVWYNLLKAYELIRPDDSLPDFGSYSGSGKTWVVFARDQTSKFFRTFAAKSKPVQNSQSSISEDSLLPIVRMMRTAMSDVQIKSLLLDRGYSEDLIDKLLSD